MIFGLDAELVEVVLGGQGVDSPTGLVVALKSVGVDHASGFEDANTATTFSAESTATIFGCHQLFWKRALLEVKVQWIQTNKLCKQHVLRLLLSFQVISKYKTALFARMTMQVDVKFQVSQFMRSHNSFLDLVNRWLKIGAGVQVEPVQIMITRVQPVVPSGYSVRVDQRYDFNNIVLK